MSWFKPDDRVVLGALADVLVPEAEGMPSATMMGFAEEGLDRVVNLRGDLAPLLLRAARMARELSSTEAVQAIRTADGDVWRALTLAIAAAYYTHPDIRARLGYTGPERRDWDAGAPLDAETRRLLAPVIARGPIWRHVGD